MNKIVRMPRGGPVSAVPRATPAPPVPGQQDGDWMWDGTRWVCCSPCDDGSVPPFPFCPPPGFPPPGCPPWFSGQNSPPWYPGANAGVSFGATAPPNPVRGHFWWNGLTLFLFDGAVWVPVGGTSAGGNTPPSGTPPANPVPGQQWFNGTTLFVWDGNAWIPVSQTKTYIQATAPPAPNPGDTWWNGTQFFIWSGSAWDLVGPGATVGPTPTTALVFSLQQPANLTVGGASAWTIMPYTATPLVDTQGMWDAVQHKLTPKVPGYYFIEVRGGSDTGTGGIAILKNDPGTFGSVASSSNVIIGNGSSANGGWITAVGISQFNGTSDFFRVWGWSSDGIMSNVGSSPAVAAVIMP
jgi:hypothetical protein